MTRGPRSVRPHARLLKYVLWLTLESSSILLTELSSPWQPLPLHPLFFKIGSHSGALAGLDSRQSSCLSLLNPEMKGRATSARAVCTHHHHQCENIFYTLQRNGHPTLQPRLPHLCVQQPARTALQALGFPGPSCCRVFPAPELHPYTPRLLTLTEEAGLVTNSPAKGQLPGPS